MQSSQLLFELIRLCALWGPPREDRESIPTILELLNKPEIMAIAGRELHAERLFSSNPCFVPCRCDSLSREHALPPLLLRGVAAHPGRVVPIEPKLVTGVHPGHRASPVSHRIEVCEPGAVQRLYDPAASVDVGISGAQHDHESYAGWTESTMRRQRRSKRSSPSSSIPSERPSRADEGSGLLMIESLMLKMTNVISQVEAHVPDAPNVHNVLAATTRR